MKFTGNYVNLKPNAAGMRKASRRRCGRFNKRVCKWSFLKRPAGKTRTRRCTSRSRRRCRGGTASSRVEYRRDRRPASDADGGGGRFGPGRDGRPGGRLCAPGKTRCRRRCAGRSRRAACGSSPRPTHSAARSAASAASLAARTRSSSSAHTLRMLGQGVKVCVESGLMALDCGSIEYNTRSSVRLRRRHGPRRGYGVHPHAGLHGEPVRHARA